MVTPLKVLILEDRPADAALMVHELRRAGFDPMWRRVETGNRLPGAPADGPGCGFSPTIPYPNLTPCGPCNCSKNAVGDTPFIIVSGNIGEELAVSAMKQGAADYLLKDRLARLGPAVARALHEMCRAAGTPAGRGGPARQRSPLPHHGRGCPGLALDGWPGYGLHVFQPTMAGVHRPQHGAGTGVWLGRECAPGRLRALPGTLHHGLCGPAAV